MFVPPGRRCGKGYTSGWDCMGFKGDLVLEVPIIVEGSRYGDIYEEVLFLGNEFYCVR